MAVESMKTKIAILENNYINMDKKLDDISSKVDNLTYKLETLPEKFDERYANKETENLVKKLIWLVISSVILAVLGLVIKSNI